MAPSRAGTDLPLAGFHDIVVDPIHRHVFITGTPVQNSSVVVVDFDGNIIARITGLFGASGMALDTAASRLYVALNTANSIAVIDTTTLRKTETIRLGPAAQCPGWLAMSGGLIWFGFSCSPLPYSQGGIGSLDPATRDIRLYVEPADHPTYIPILATSTGAPDTLLASDSLVHPFTLYEYAIDQDGLLTLTAEVRDPGGGTFLLHDLALSADGSTLVTAAWDPDHLQVFDVPGLVESGSYDSGSKPIAVAMSSDGAWVAGGSEAPGEPDVYLFQTGNPEPQTVLELSWLSETAPQLYPGGLAFGPESDSLYIVSGDLLGTVTELHVRRW